MAPFFDCSIISNFFPTMSFLFDMSFVHVEKNSLFLANGICLIFALTQQSQHGNDAVVAQQKDD